jgi:hypothetical protein
MPRATGPLLDTGRGDSRGWFEDIPLGMGILPDYHLIFDDFNRVDDDQTNDWTVVKDAGASVGIVADTVGGELALTSTATTDNDGASIQGNEVFKPVAAKDIWFKTRIKTSDADQTDIFVGLAENFGTNPENVLAASNMIGFLVADGAASIFAKTEKADTETSTDTTSDLTDATYIELAFHVTGVTSVEYFVNGVLKATITTNIPIVEMALCAFSLSGDAVGTRVTTLDYLFCAQKR